MKKKVIIGLLVIALGAGGFFAYSNGSFKKTVEDKVVATVNGKPVYESEIKGKVQRYLELNSMSAEGIKYETLDKTVKEEIMKNIILGDLILKEAKDQKIDQTAEFKDALQFTEAQLTQRIYLDKLLKENVTDAKVQAKYEEMAASLSNKVEYKASHILVKTEEEAKEIKLKLDKGADFAALAKEYSLDNNKDDGGNLGYFTKGQMVPTFEEAVASLKVGETSSPVKTDFGYHIIKLEDKRVAQAPSLDQLNTKIREELSAEFVQNYVSQLKKTSNVEFVE
jgi:peptidyl-prolyl cis-trans isomerase C